MKEYIIRPFYTIMATVLLSLQGCAQVADYHPLPKNMESEVQVPGFPHVRAWGDAYSKSLENSARTSILQEKAAHHGVLPPVVSGIALSGGGADGAFGAGLICGWTASGTRPQFKFVTGISTGSLMAPLVFLGPAYDERLKRAYTTISDKDIYTRNNIFLILLSLANLKPLSSAADNAPLAHLIETIIDEPTMRKIAEEHRKGRRLFMGTTQLDAQRLVIWDMGEIANSRSPDALKLFRKIMLASASLPVSFPPQFFDVEAAGNHYKEMHVDGGVEAQVMLYEDALAPMGKLEHTVGIDRQRNLYILRNDKILPVWEATKPQLKYIAMRTIDSLIHSQGIGDLYRLYLYSVRDHMDYHLAYIPPEFNVHPESEFDNHYMRKLFALGYAQGRSGYQWHPYPPGYEPNRDRTPVPASA